jgi:RecA/RadA recombinase
MAKAKVNIDDIFDEDVDEVRNIISTGLVIVDPALGGGIPQGVLGESFGPSGSGKTSLMYCHIAAQQKLGNNSVLIDAEGSWNPAMGARYGIDTKHVNKKGLKTFKLSSKAEMQVVENLFEAIKKILYNIPEVTFILVDSLAALSTLAAVAKKEGDQTNTDAMEKAARLSFYLRELKRWIADTGFNTTVVFINHEKEVIGMGGYGPPKTDTPGGKALKFYSTFRLQHRLVKTEKVKYYDPVTKQEINKEDKLYIRVQAVKNREHAPFQPSTFVFDVGGGTGIDKVRTALAHAQAQGVITPALKEPEMGKNGKLKKAEEKKGYYTVPAEYSATGEDTEIHGMPKLVRYFEENSEAFNKMEQHVADNLDKSDAIELPDDDEVDIDDIAGLLEV